MIRRRKFLAKPNMMTATAGQSQSQQPAEEKEKSAVATRTETTISTETTSAPTPVDEPEPIPTDDPPANNVLSPAIVEPESQPQQLPISSSKCQIDRRESFHLTELQPVQLPSIEHMINHSSYAPFSPQFGDGRAATFERQIEYEDREDEEEEETERTEHQHRPVSARPSVIRQDENSAGREKGEKRLAIKDKLVDTKKFRMADLVSWRPKTENTLKKKWSEKRKQQRNMEAEGKEGKAAVKSELGIGPGTSGSSTSTSAGPSSSTTSSSSAAGPGPRVKINERGEMVVDEASLVVMNGPDSAQWETVDDDLMPKKLTSLSFRKKPRRGQTWSVLETDLFYEVLAATGTDFGLMHEFIPTRTRAELKTKFNREERQNARRINETLRHPTLLDERLRQRVERMLVEMGDKDM